MYMCLKYTMYKSISHAHAYTYMYRFNQVFDWSTKQDDVFESVAQGVADK